MRDVLYLESPTRCRLPSAWGDPQTSVGKAVAEELGYEDAGAKHEWRVYRDAQLAEQKNDRAPSKTHRPHWFVSKFGRGALDAKVAQLDAARKKSVLFADENGPWTYSGLIHRLAAKFDAVVGDARYSHPHLTDRWNTRVIPKEFRPFQRHIIDEFRQHTNGLVGGPVSAEVATGAGKSVMFLELVRRFGLPALIMTPSVPICEQFYAQATEIFGDGEVGKFYGGKKQADRPIVIATSASVCRATGVNAAQLASKKVLGGDESHTLPAAEIVKSVTGVLADIPYRFMLSGSQLRGDGTELVLEGVLGKIVRRVTVTDCVTWGYLARPHFTQIAVRSSMPSSGYDAVALNRAHYRHNEALIDQAAVLVRAALERGYRPLVAVEEVGQCRRLLKQLAGLRVAFAHSGAGNDDREWLPEQHWRPDVTALVAGFDAGEYDVMVGTGCIATGTDFQTVDYIVDLCGLASEVRIRQLAGRGTRRGGGKTDFHYVDFDVVNVPVLHKQAEKRRAIFDSICGPVNVIA